MMRLYRLGGGFELRLAEKFALRPDVAVEWYPDHTTASEGYGATSLSVGLGFVIGATR